MRPILTLKKKPAPDLLASVAIPAEPVQPAEPAKPVEPAKAAKQSPNEAQAAKEARAAANRLLGQELADRRRAYSEKLKPLLEAYFSDKAILRETVLIDGVECLRPLAVGIHKTIFAWLREQPDAQGASNTLLMDLIKAVLGLHVAQPKYLAGLLNCQDRFDLDGNATGVVKDKQRERAEKAWKKVQNKTLPAGEANVSTRKALAELEAGKGKQFAGVDALIADLPAAD